MAHRKIKKPILRKAQTESFLKFLEFFNKFVNHAKKLRSEFIEKDMRL